MNVVNIHYRSKRVVILKLYKEVSAAFHCCQPVNGWQNRVLRTDGTGKIKSKFCTVTYARARTFTQMGNVGDTSGERKTEPAEMFLFTESDIFC